MEYKRRPNREDIGKNTETICLHIVHTRKEEDNIYAIRHIYAKK